MRMAVHTDAPRDLLRAMVRETDVLAGSTGTGEPGCIYGLGERLDPERGCREHSLVSTEDKETAKWVAFTLKGVGYQVWVTPYDNWSVTLAGLPENYNHHHMH
jgi:hypothetical protein